MSDKDEKQDWEPLFRHLANIDDWLKYIAYLAVFWTVIFLVWLIYLLCLLW